MTDLPPLPGLPPQGPARPQNADEADWWLLSQTRGKNKFAVPVAAMPPFFEYYQAHERGLDEGWFELLDVRPMAEDPRNVYRVYRLLPAGVRRRAALALKYGVLGQVPKQ